MASEFLKIGESKIINVRSIRYLEVSKTPVTGKPVVTVYSEAGKDTLEDDAAAELLDYVGANTVHGKEETLKVADQLRVTPKAAKHHGKTPSPMEELAKAGGNVK